MNFDGFFKNRIRGSATQQIFIIKYRYYIIRFSCEKTYLLNIVAWVEPQSVNCTSEH